MRLETLATREVPGGRRVVARVAWEGPMRGPDSLWFEVVGPSAADLEPAPEAFLLAAWPVATWCREPRLLVEGRICARLRDGLEAGGRLLASWYPRCRPVSVEASGGFVALPPRATARAGMFLSGGIDSLSLLRRNREEHAVDAAPSIREALFLFGFHTEDFAAQVPRPARLRAHEEQRERLERFAVRAGTALTAVRTNVRTFHPGYHVTRDVAFGAGMVAVAHALRARFSDVWLASGGYPDEHPPHGSHPDLDPLFSSGAVEVRHGEADRTRLEKVRSLAGLDDAFDALQVCLQHEPLPPGHANCGRCEKCLRTMLAFVAVGREDRLGAFGRARLAPDEVAGYRPRSAHARRFAEEIADALVARGRADLASALRRALSRAAWRDRRRAVRRWARSAVLTPFGAGRAREGRFA